MLLSLIRTVPTFLESGSPGALMLCGCRYVALSGVHTLQGSKVLGTQAFNALCPVLD